MGNRRHGDGRLARQDRVNYDTCQDGDRDAWHDATEDNLGWHVERELIDRAEHHQVDQVIGKQRPERAEIGASKKVVGIAVVIHGRLPLLLSILCAR